MLWSYNRRLINILYCSFFFSVSRCGGNDIDDNDDDDEDHCFR